MQTGDRFDKYTIERVLGEGGMATVYLARHDVLGSLHALKVLRVGAPEIRKRLLAEGRVQASIHHPNVVSVTDIVESPAGVALVMEYVDGIDLEKCLVDDGALTPTEALELFRGIVEGVAAAHREGVVHRDLKPANILLHQAHGRRVPKVTDFGLVKILESNATRSGVLMGTPEYMSPEQVRDSAKVDHRSDLWALGALLYEMLTGHVAFDREDIVQVYTAIVEADYVPLSELRPSLPPRVFTAVDKLLQVDVDARFARAEELIDHLYPDEAAARETTVPRAERRPSGDDTVPSADPTERRRPPPTPDAPTAGPRSMPPPRPPAPSRRWTVLGAAMIALAGVLCTGGAGVAWWVSPPVPPGPREVVLRPIGPDGPLPPDAPLQVHLGDALYRGARPIPLGPRAVGGELTGEVVYGVDCDTCPTDCPSWCARTPVRLTVPEGRGPVELSLEIRPPDPVPVTVRARGASVVRVGEQVQEVMNDTATLSLVPGRHDLVAQRGSCNAAPPDCSAEGSCPDGCEASAVQAIDVGLSAVEITIDLPTPTKTPAPTVQPPPQPAVAPAPRPDPPALVSNQAFAAFVARHPDWEREAAIARGAADRGYLRDWSDGPPPGPATRLSWKAAAAFCAERGGLLGIGEPPLTWDAGAVQLEWREGDTGGLAWRRFDGITSAQARPEQTVPFTGVRCRR